MIQLDRSLVVEEMLNLAVRCVDLLGSCNWMLLDASYDKFVTSNKPVNPVWIRNRRQMPRIGELDTFIVFPLGDMGPLQLQEFHRLLSTGLIEYKGGR